MIWCATPYFLFFSLSSPLPLSPPPAARITWHRLILGSIYMDSVHKKDLAVTLTANYCQLQKNFVADSHHHDVCVSALY